MCVWGGERGGPGREEPEKTLEVKSRDRRVLRSGELQACHPPAHVFQAEAWSAPVHPPTTSLAIPGAPYSPKRRKPTQPSARHQREYYSPQRPRR